MRVRKVVTGSDEQRVYVPDVAHLRAIESWEALRPRAKGAAFSFSSSHSLIVRGKRGRKGGEEVDGWSLDGRLRWLMRMKGVVLGQGG